MGSECEVRDLRENVECQQVYEDSEIRIYLSVVRSEPKRVLGVKKVRSRHHKRQLIRWALIAAALVVEAVAFIGTGVGVSLWLSNLMEQHRGYLAIGGEIFIGPMIVGLVSAIAETVIGGGAALENELNKMLRQ